jgi:DNA primase
VWYLDRIFEQGRKELLKSEKALRYLMSRGVSKDQILSMNLGYIPDEGWPPFIDEKKATEQEKYYWNQSYKGSKLKGKLLFPMTNARGQIRGFQVRTPEKGVKDYWKFYDLHADVDALFFGTHLAIPHIWDTGKVLLVEGIFDIFPAQRSFPFVLCTGTANVSKLQITFLKRYVKHVMVMFDNDEFGDKFWREFSFEHKKQFERLTQVTYHGKDPSDSWERLGEDRFQEQFTNLLDIG